MTSMNWNEALSEYGIGFNVSKRPVQALVGDGQVQLVDNLYSIVREDTNEVLPGVGVNGRYKCIQAQSYADIGNRICGELGAEFVNGGLFRGGKLVYLQAKLPGNIRIAGTDDVIEKMLTFLTSHDGSTCFMLMPTALRIFCENQMAALNREARDGIKIRHTASAGARLEMADEKIMEIMGAYNAFDEQVNRLAVTPFNDTQMVQALRKAFSIKPEQDMDSLHTRTAKNVEKVLNNFQSGLGINAANRGTAWAALNAFTEYSTHGRNLNGKTDVTESMMVGSGATFNYRAIKAIEGVLAA